MPTPQLVVLRADFTLGCGPGTTIDDVCQHSRVVGEYVDDTTPHLDFWLAQAVAEYPFNLRAVAMSQAHRRPRDCRWAHVLCLVEWYPFCSGFPLKDWGAFPQAIGVILQDRYRGFTGRCQPTRHQVSELIARAERLGDYPILLY